MAENKVILFERKGPIAIITMNRPAKYNAMDGELYGKLHEAVREYVNDNSLLCAIITGAGDNFSSGGDLKWFQEMRGKYGEGWDYDYPAYKLLDRCNKPVIAAIDGYCIASGFNLATLYCDFRIASERAKFGIPAVKRGLRLSYPIPFPWHMTLGNALYMVLTGKLLSADEALRMGVVSELVPHEKLMERTMELATGIAESAPMHIRCHKEFLRRFVEAPGFGQRLIDVIFEPLKSLKDSSEGRLAFIEKRKAKYENK